MTDRTTARVVGSLFIVATVAGVVAAMFERSLGAGDYLVQVSPEENSVATGVLLVLVMAAAVIAISIVLYPVLRRFSERLAMGYVVARTIEGVTFVVSTLAALALVTLSREFVATGTPEAASYRAVGDTLVGARDWVDAALGVVAFSLSALMLNYVLFRTRLVPRWLSTWGLAGAALYLAAGVMVLYGLEPFSATQNVLNAPMFLQEMVFAVWLIAKGFNVPATAPIVVPEREPVSVGG
jgi:hypothetical protein